VLERCGRLDRLAVNNAGITARLACSVRMKTADWKAVIDLISPDVFSSALRGCSRACLQGAAGGRIIKQHHRRWSA